MQQLQRRQDAFEQGKEEGDQAYAERILLGVAAIVMVHLFRAGYEQCPVATSGTLQRIFVECTDTHVVVKSAAWSDEALACFPRGRGEIILGTRLDEFERRTVALTGALLTGVLDPGADLRFSLPGKEPDSVVTFAIRHGGLVQLTPWIERLELFPKS
jgi:hypothetical protein